VSVTLITGEAVLVFECSGDRAFNELSRQERVGAHHVGQVVQALAVCG
jgi:hypothetical protein